MQRDNSDKLTRRTVVGAAAGAVALVPDPMLAQRLPDPPRAKGPPVWLDMDQQALNEAYDQSVYAFNREAIFERGREAVARALARIGPPRRVAYGPAEIEKLDIYRTQRANAPTLVFLHGGVWSTGRASNHTDLAEMFIKAGANFIAVDFSSVDDTAGDLTTLVDQCRRAIAFVHRNAASFGGSADRIYLSGHSSGAHLAGCVLITEWAKEGLPPDIVKGALLLSGMYDLEPVRLSSRSSFVKLTDEIEDALSAQRHLDRLSTPLIITYGSLETPEFQRQSRDFAAALIAAGKHAQLLVGKGYNHFEIYETLGNPYGVAGRAALEMMKLRV
jgi:arylformamidase